MTPLTCRSLLIKVEMNPRKKEKDMPLAKCDRHCLLVPRTLHLSKNMHYALCALHFTFLGPETWLLIVSILFVVFDSPNFFQIKWYHHHHGRLAVMFTIPSVHVTRSMSQNSCKRRYVAWCRHGRLLKDTMLFGALQNFPFQLRITWSIIGSHHLVGYECCR